MSELKSKSEKSAKQAPAPVSYNQVFEEKFRSILFPEPYFTEYLRELESKNRTLIADWNEAERDKYIRYLRTWRRGVKLHVANRHVQMMREIHCHKLINFIEKVFKDGGKMYTDLEIHVENEQFMAHRLVIACYAPFIFHKLARTPRTEDTRKIRLTGIKAAPFAIILEYMYTGMAHPNDANFLPVLDTAIRFFMYEFADTWVELYEEKFGSRTSQLLFRSKIARRYKWNNYVRKLNKVLALDFENLLVSTHFVELSYEELSDLLKENDIGVRNEVILYMAVLKWLKYDLDARKQHVLPLISLVRFPLMCEEEIFACYNPPILKDVINQSEIKALMADALNFHIKKRSAGKAIDLPNNVEMRNYRLTNNSQLKLWSVEDQKMDLDASLSKSAKSYPPSLEPHLNLVDSKEMDVKDAEQKSHSELKQSDVDSSKYVNKFKPETQQTSQSSSEEPTYKSKIDTFESNNQPTDLKIDCFETSQSNAKEYTNKSFGSPSFANKSSTSGFVCQCEKPFVHKNILECQAYKASKRIQSASKELSNQSAIDVNDPTWPTDRTQAAIVSDTKQPSSLCTNSLITDAKGSQSPVAKGPAASDTIVISTGSLAKDHQEAQCDTTSGSKTSIHTLPLDLPALDSKQMNSRSYSYPKITPSSPERNQFATTHKPMVNQQKSLTTPSTSSLPKHLFVLLADSLQMNTSGIYTYQPLIKVSNADQGDTIAEISHLNFKPRMTNPAGGLTMVSQLTPPTDAGSATASNVLPRNGWKKVANFAQAHMLPLESIVIAHQNALYVIGGLLKGVNSKQVTMHASKFIYHYGLKEQSLKRVGELRVPRVLHCGALINDKILVVGGLRTPGIPLNTIEVFDLKDMCLNAGQIRIPSYPRFGAACAEFRNRLWIVGGIAKIENSFHLLSEIWVLDVNEEKWSKSKFPVPIAYASMVAIDNETLFVIGGRSVSLTGQLQPSDKVWMYSHQNRRWTQFTSASLSKPRCNACLLTVDHRLYLLGGCSENDVEHLRGTLAEMFDLQEPGRGWQPIDRLPVPICGQTVAHVQCGSI